MMEQDTVVGRFRSIRQKYVDHLIKQLGLTNDQQILLGQGFTDFTQELLRDCVTPHIQGRLPLGVADSNSEGVKWGIS